MHNAYIINESKIRCRQVLVARKNLVTLPHKTFAIFTNLGNIRVSQRRKYVISSYGLMHRCNGVIKSKQAESKVSNCVFGKCIFGRCDDSCMGTEIHLLLGRYMIGNAIGELTHPTTLDKSLWRPILVNETKTKLIKIL